MTITLKHQNVTWLRKRSLYLLLPQANITFVYLVLLAFSKKATSTKISNYKGCNSLNVTEAKSSEQSTALL